MESLEKASTARTSKFSGASRSRTQARIAHGDIQFSALGQSGTKVNCVVAIHGTSGLIS
jgi:hypothetical protein